METRSRMSRSLHTNRDFEKLEPYEGKPSRTVLRGEEGSNALDLPDRPSDLNQRDGRAVRKGNRVAKKFAENKVDVLIYATEKSLNAYQFNILSNKQQFISQLKNQQLGSRTLDEGSMDKESGMNYAEYMAILSGNTDLLDKARLDKQIKQLEKEYVLFKRDKLQGERYLDTLSKEINKNKIASEIMKKDFLIMNNKSNSFFTLENKTLLHGKDVGKYMNDICRPKIKSSEWLTVALWGDFEICGAIKGESVIFSISSPNGKHYYTGSGCLPASYNEVESYFNNICQTLETRSAKLDIKYQELKEEYIKLDKSIKEKKWNKIDKLNELKTEVTLLEEKIKQDLKKIEEGPKQEDLEEKEQINDVINECGVENPKSTEYYEAKYGTKSKQEENGVFQSEYNIESAGNTKSVAKGGNRELIVDGDRATIRTNGKDYDASKVITGLRSNGLEVNNLPKEDLQSLLCGKSIPVPNDRSKNMTIVKGVAGYSMKTFDVAKQINHAAQQEI